MNKVGHEHRVNTSSRKRRTERHTAGPAQGVDTVFPARTTLQVPRKQSAQTNPQSGYFAYHLVVYLSPSNSLPCFLYKMKSQNLVSTVPST